MMKTRLIIETHMIVLVPQFASTIDFSGNITNFTENCAGKSLCFFLRLKGDLFSNFCVCHNNKRYNQENILLTKKDMCMCSLIRVSMNFEMTTRGCFNLQL